MEKIIKGRFKNNGEYKEEDKYTPILKDDVVMGFIESVDKENINIILWERCISKKYLCSESLHESEKVLCSISFC